MKPGDTYECATCHGVFETGWTEEEALAELEARHGVPPEECGIVCDDCFQAMGLASKASRDTEHTN